VRGGDFTVFTHVDYYLPSLNYINLSEGRGLYLPMAITTCLFSLYTAVRGEHLLFHGNYYLPSLTIYHSEGRGLLFTHGDYYLPSLTYMLQ
jgi:hypothetical protein